MEKKKPKSLIIGLVAAHLVGSAFAEDGHAPHMHHHFPKDVEAFHSVLAPLWHAAPGKGRSRDACAKAGEMDTLARDIRSGDAAPLIASVVALKARCQDAQGDIDAALSDVHEAFHRLAEPGHGR